MFFKLPLLLVTFALCLLSHVNSTEVSKCRRSKTPPPTDNDVVLSACERPPCRLIRDTEPSVSITFKPNSDIEGVTTRVSGYILGVPFPFIGVDGKSACPHIYSEDGSSHVGCPLNAGQSYMYKNSFKVLEIYPKINVDVAWSLINNRTNEDLVCFEMPSKIV